MNEKSQHSKPKRHYPPVYERIVPVALGIIVVTIIVLLFIIVSVAVGLFPGSG